MDELTEIYRRIEYLRNNGVKMKEMADHTDMAASVFSSLYSSVLPTYIAQVKKGRSQDEALDYALAQVNNVSKKRLLGSLADMRERLFRLEPRPDEAAGACPLLTQLADHMARSSQEAACYGGIYMSYSLSSSRLALKAEPYLIRPDESGRHVSVLHASAYDALHHGTCLLSGHQNAYIFFNERESPQLAPFSIYLQLPMYDRPQLLKGLYLSLDYNRNPIARRIVFVKQSDSTSTDDFLALKGRLVPPEELTDELMPYFNYACQKDDCIKTCTVPSPRLDVSDLEREKRMLDI